MIHHAFLIEENKLIQVFKEYYIDNIKQYELAVPSDLELVVTNEISFRLYAKQNKIDTSAFDDDFNFKIELPNEGINNYS